MIKRFFNNYRKRNRIKKKERKKNRSIEDKQKEWNKRWGSDDYTPFWKLDDFPPLIRELIDSGKIAAGASIMDIGCGSGSLAAMLSDEGFDVLGFDFAETAIEKARQYHSRPDGKLRFITADATRPLPFQDTFDVGIDRGTFHTLPGINRGDYVQCIRPSIREGGLLVMIYAMRIAKKLVESSDDDPGVLLRQHLEKHFGNDFLIEAFREVTIDSHKEEDPPGFLILFRRRADK